MTQKYTLQQLINSNPNGENLDIKYLASRLQFALNTDETPEALKLAIRDYIEKDMDFAAMPFYEPEYIGAYFSVYMDRYEKRQGAREAFNFLRMFSTLVENTPRKSLAAPTIVDDVMCFLTNSSTSETRQQSLVDFLNYEFIEAYISLTDDEILPAALKQFSQRASEEDYAAFTAQIAEIMNGKLWKFETEHAEVRKAIAENFSEPDESVDFTLYKLADDVSDCLENHDGEVSDLLEVLDDLNGKDTYSREQVKALVSNASASKIVEIEQILNTIVGAPKAITPNERVNTGELAKALSVVLNHPDCPDKLHEVISDEIGTFQQPEDYFSSPEYISKVLEAQAAKVSAIVAQTETPHPLASKIVTFLESDGGTRQQKLEAVIEKWCSDKGVSPISYRVLPCALSLLFQECSDNDLVAFEQEFLVIANETEIGGSQE